MRFASALSAMVTRIIYDNPVVYKYENSVLITGEAHEWEFVEYVHDAHQMGLRKALVMVGHVASEESGVEFFCNYLRDKSPSHSISYIKTNDLFKVHTASC